MSEIDQYDTTTHVVALCKYGRVGPRLFDALFARFGSLAGVLQADEGSLLSLSGMTQKTARAVVKARQCLPQAAEYLGALSQREIQVRTRFDRDYPTLLFELNDPPPLLYVKGKLPDAGRKSAALVGTSTPSNEAIEMTTRLARTFAENDVQVVSTFRGGIDMAGHLGCQAAGGVSFAVLSSGMDALVDQEAVRVAIDIALTGGVISEYEPETPDDAAHLEAANRLLVGLAQAVVVTEFYHDSPQTLDLLHFCQMIGKLMFVMIDPDHGAFSDEAALAKALEYGAIPIEGYDKVSDIIRSLV